MARLKLFVAGLLCCVAGSTGMIYAQDNTAVVPDVRGLTVPVAAAVLNRSGFFLGTQTNAAWTAAMAYLPNTVGEQSIAPGETAPRGVPVALTIFRPPNVTLIYDDNDITLINRAGVPLEIAGLVFTTVESITPASFEAISWRIRAIEANNCGQLWSVARSGEKPVEGCDVINWMSTNKPEFHFWTALNGVASFKVVQDGVDRAVCPAAQAGAEPITCEFYLLAAALDPETPYLVFTYTVDRLVIFNRSSDRWMPLEGILVSSTAGGPPVAIGDPALYAPALIPGIINRLAPGQCLLFVSGGVTAAAPETCDVIARLDYPAGVGFWKTNFEVDGITTPEKYVCPAAMPAKRTICILPR